MPLGQEVKWYHLSKIRKQFLHIWRKVPAIHRAHEMVCVFRGVGYSRAQGQKGGPRTENFLRSYLF